MSLTSRKASEQQYTMNDQPIPLVQTNDYHGVTISSNLSLTNQCDKVCNKAKRTLELVKRTLHSADTSCNVRKTVYKMLVHPFMEYAIQNLENVQKSTARFVWVLQKEGQCHRKAHRLNWDILARVVAEDCVGTQQ